MTDYPGSATGQQIDDAINANLHRALLLSRYASGVEGGDFTTGAWRTRDLNTIAYDPQGMITLPSPIDGSFTLGAGTYRFDGWGIGAKVGRNQMRIVVTSASPLQIIEGSSDIAATAATIQSKSTVSGYLQLTGSSVIELQHQCATTHATNGFGLSSGYADYEVYASLEIIKIA